MFLAVAIGAQGTGGPLQEDRGEVVEQQRPVLKVALGQLGLDGFLVGQKPIHGPIEFFNLHGAQLQGLTQGGCLGVPQIPREGELAAGIQDSAHNHGQDQVPLSAMASQQKGVQAQSPGRAQHRLNVAVGHRPDHLTPGRTVLAAGVLIQIARKSPSPVRFIGRACC